MLRAVRRRAVAFVDLLRRQVVAAVTAAAAAVFGVLLGAPWGSLLAFPVGVIARELERARTSDLRREALETAAARVRGALDARLRLKALQPMFVQYHQTPRMRDFANVDEHGVVAGAVFHVGRDGYQLEEQLRELHAWVDGGTGRGASHLSTSAQRALARFLDAVATASDAAGAMTLADGTASYERMNSEARTADPAAAAAAGQRRDVEVARLREAVRDATAVEELLARELN